MKKPIGSVGRPSDENKQIKHPEFAERLTTFMAKKDMARKDMVRALGCTDAVFGNYCNGFRLPDWKYADKIADKLGVTVGYLVYGKQDEAPTILEVPAKSKLTPEEIYILKRIMEKIIG